MNDCIVILQTSDQDHLSKRKRREVIPADPKFMTDIDLTLPVFLYQDGESVVKGEQVLSDGRRIILFTTKEHLKILARAVRYWEMGLFG